MEMGTKCEEKKNNVTGTRDDTDEETDEGKEKTSLLEGWAVRSKHGCEERITTSFRPTHTTRGGLSTRDHRSAVNP